VTVRDLNRYRKIYPARRVRARNIQVTADVEAIIESAQLNFNAESTKTYAFEENFPGAPIVTATAYDSQGNQQTNVNIYTTSVSTTSVTINASAAFTGAVHIHALYQL